MINDLDLKMKYEELLDKCSKKQWFNKELLVKALEFGNLKHLKQKRKISDEPYFIHPIRVAINLIDEPDTDIDVIVAALLHDTVEDTETTYNEIESNFGRKIEILVNGMTKPDSKQKLTNEIDKFYENYFKKIRNYSEIDKRVLKIKLSDRIDNLKDYMLFSSKEKTKRYLWESSNYLEICSEFFVETDLITRLMMLLESIKTSVESKA